MSKIWCKPRAIEYIMKLKCETVGPTIGSIATKQDISSKIRSQFEIEWRCETQIEL